MADLEPKHKRFIVERLARFETPTEVAEAVKERFDGLEVTRQQVRHYNPEQSDEVAKEWVTLFKRSRGAFIKSQADIAIAHKSYRLDQLGAMLATAKRNKSWKLAAALIEQAAREEGGQYTNTQKQEVTGADGGKIEVDIVATKVDYRQATAPLAPDDAANK